MKELYLFISALTVSYIINAQNVNIPDPYFKAALIDVGIDTSGDGEISFSEAEAITNLDVSGTTETQTYWISDMTGIEAFINLDTLDCHMNHDIAVLNVTNNTDLKFLNCSKNSLTVLDLSNNPALAWLECYRNNLTSLDLFKWENGK